MCEMTLRFVHDDRTLTFQFQKILLERRKNQTPKKKEKYTQKSPRVCVCERETYRYLSWENSIQFKKKRERERKYEIKYTELNTQ